LAGFACHDKPILDATAKRGDELAELLMRCHIATCKRNIERHYQEALANPSKTRGDL
jgi:DNA-binding GntR family transcriptional regulator